MVVCFSLIFFCLCKITILQLNISYWHLPLKLLLILECDTVLPQHPWFIFWLLCLYVASAFIVTVFPTSLPACQLIPKIVGKCRFSSLRQRPYGYAVHCFFLQGPLHVNCVSVATSNSVIYGFKCTKFCIEFARYYTFASVSRAPNHPVYSNFLSFFVVGVCVSVWVNTT